MNRRLLVLAALLLGASLVPTLQPSARASCVAPYLTLRADGRMPARPPVLDRGDGEITVHGRAFVIGCNDTGIVTEGPFGCESRQMADEEEPVDHVRLVLRQDGRGWQLGTEDTADGGRLTWAITLPDGVRRGPARLIAHAPDEAGGTAMLRARVR